MDVFDFIDKLVSRKQIPYLRLMTIYTNDGFVNNIVLTKYNDKKIAKKAKKVGLTDDKQFLTGFGIGIKLKNPPPYDIQKGKYYLNYYFDKHDLNIYKE